MSIKTPSLDFTHILRDIGQTITVRNITRTVDSNGAVTVTSTVDTDITAIVQEVSMKEKVWIQAGLIDLGDIIFLVGPSSSLTIYDQILWNAVTYKIRKILLPPRINGSLLFKQILTVKDSA